MLKGKEIKRAIKEAGIDTSKVSVREGRGGYSLVFYVRIKDKSIDLKEIEKITNRFVYYETDERTGEILSGGNTFIFVDYDYELSY